MAITEGIAALSSLKSLYEIARDVRNSTDAEKLRAAAAQMFDLALAAREQTAALQEARNAAVVELAALKAEIEQANEFDAQKENYVRERTAYTGATVYREKGSEGPQAPSPYYCPNCFTHRKISILNPIDERGGTVRYACAVCGTGTPLPRLYNPAQKTS